MVVKHLRVGTLVACVILQSACGLRAQMLRLRIEFDMMNL